MLRTLRLDAVLIQAVIAGALSFAHLHDLAAAAGQDGWKAWAYPVSVDLLLVAAWRRMRKDGGNRDAWLWFAIALIASLGANVATAGLLDVNDVPDWLRILVAGWPALAFLGGTLLAHAHAPEPQPVPEPAAEADREPAVPDLVVERVPEPSPALPPAEPASEETPSAPETAQEPASPASVPPALLDHARKIADAHRAQTGVPIDAATLRARLGIPASLADSIALQLA
ncbi:MULTISPECIES: DUF2637 domain-containing protein [Streptomyces]|uniref:SpdA protein n=1 Tax=Streptomyces venezuelae (strain ATCC 10712 / CBS 650.69 / DSM 40230 / JCM 4526 / NBRC 13096 / PD 04745) TaxID=953739 RepID=F2RFY6_STRVP|nr:DUF2637 domain-containing protein [Streptomyces venezuelae]APE23020.1 SpdA protein [Streptomyces venezuelae]QES00402.1 DUF2637 domain-containing protein [Streptomyces venezuelae ATCC 10712]CCA57288.1 SpdA protein [Streptomyces venezuelae ATCC 10712]